MSSGCGNCLYGKNKTKYEDGKQVECMLEGYTVKRITYRCPKYKRDFNKNIVTKGVTNVHTS